MNNMTTLRQSLKTCISLYRNAIYNPVNGKHILYRELFCSTQKLSHQRFQIFRSGDRVKRVNWWKLLAHGSIIAAVVVSKKDDETDQVILILKHAKLAEMKGEFDQAGKYYHRVLGLLSTYKQLKSWDDSKILKARIHVYDNMANLALAQGEFKQAENLYSETIKGLLQDGVEKDDNAIIEISLKLAMNFAMQEKFEEAEQGYKYAIEMQEKKITRESSDDKNTIALLGMCMNSYGRFLMIRNRFSEAQTQLEKAVSVAKKALGDDSEQIGVMLNDIANLAMSQRKYDYALEKLNDAVTLSEENDSDDVAVYYCNIGEVFLKKGNLEKAKENCTKAYDLAKKVKHKEAIENAKSCLKDIKNMK